MEAKHNGDLDEVGMAHVEWEGRYISIWESGVLDSLSFTPRQFLSLLAWGAQNREKLEQLAQEKQEGQNQPM